MASVSPQGVQAPTKTLLNPPMACKFESCSLTSPYNVPYDAHFQIFIFVSWPPVEQFIHLVSGTLFIVCNETSELLAFHVCFSSINE